MAENERRYKLSLDTEDLKRNLNNLREDLGRIGNNIRDNIQRPLNALGSVGSKALSGIGKIGSTAFKVIGTAIKGAGIGLLLSALAALWESLKKNQKIMDLVSNAINAMGIFIKPLIDGIASLVDKFTANKELMEQTKTVIGDLITVAFTPLKLTINAIKLGIQSAMLAWEDSMFGGKDADKIKQLNADIQETKQALNDVKDAAVDSTKSFAKNIGGVVKGVSKIVQETATEVKTAYSKITIDSITAQATAMTQAKKNLDILQKQQEKITKLAETEAEKQRQLRDDATKPFAERIAANEKLGKILEQQAIDEKANIMAQIAAQSTLNSLDKDNEEGKNALYDLNVKLLDVEARITGQRSEQLSNVNALKAEELASAQAIIDAENKRSDQEKQAAIDREKDFDKQSQMAKDLAKEKRDRDLKMYEEQSKNMNLTQAERDMALQNMLQVETDYKLKIQELDDKEAEHKAEIAAKQAEDERVAREKRIADDKAERDAKIDAAKQTVNSVKELDENLTAFKTNLLANQLKNGKITQEDYDKKVAEIEMKAAKRKKAYAIAETIINTAAAMISAFKDVPKFDFGISAGVLAAGIGILGAAQVATIASQPISGGGGGSSSGSLPSGGGGGTSAPSPSTSFTFDEVKQQPQPQAQVIKTYVVSKDINTQQELDRQTIGNGTI